MTKNGLVSVIMPVFNGARFLAEAIDSALAQVGREVEVIVVDDGSTDDTPTILERYGHRIRTLRQQNQGAAVARNAAIAAASGEYIAFLDADDLWVPDKLRLQIDHLDRHPDVDLVYSNWTVLDTARAPVVAQPSTRTEPDASVDAAGSGWLYPDLLLDCIIHTTTVVMRRRLIDRIGLFDPELRRGQDYDFWLRASRVTPIHKLRAALSVYRLHDANSTRRLVDVNYSGVILERSLRQWGRQGPDGRRTPYWRMRARLAASWSGFAYEHARAGNAAVARRGFLRSLAADALQPKLWVYALATLSPASRRMLGWR